MVAKSRQYVVILLSILLTVAVMIIIFQHIKISRILVEDYRLAILDLGQRFEVLASILSEQNVHTPDKTGDNNIITSATSAILASLHRIQAISSYVNWGSYNIIREHASFFSCLLDFAEGTLTEGSKHEMSSLLSSTALALKDVAYRSSSAKEMEIALNAVIIEMARWGYKNEKHRGTAA